MNTLKINRYSVIDKIFLDNFVVAALMELSVVGAGVVDGIVVSRYLQNDSMAAFGLAQPFFSIIAIFFGLFSTGMQTVCSQELGKGNIKEFNRLFMASFYTSGIFALFAMIFSLLFSNQIATILGASENAKDLLNGTSDYIMGLAIGIPALILNAVLSPAMQMDSGRKRVLIAAIIDIVSDITFDFIAVYNGLGLFGIGLATSIGRYIRLGFLFLHFMDKSHLLRFVPLKTNIREFIHILSFGTEKAWRRLGNVIRPVIVNKMLLIYGGTMAMTAMSVRSNISDLTEVLAVGLADTVGLLSGIYYGEKNEESMNSMGKSVHRICLIACGISSAILILFSKLIATFYIGNNEDLISITAFALIGVAIQCPLQALVRSRICYVQRIERTNDMRKLIIISTVIYPIISVFVLGSIFGVYGAIMCYTLGDLLTLITIWLYYAIKNKKIIPSPKTYMNLPNEFELNPGDVISLDIRNMEDVSLTSEQISMFCKGHKLSSKVANHAAICFEEMATNTIKYGFPMNKQKVPIIDLRVIISGGKLIIKMQDNCPKYDVGARIAKLTNPNQDEIISNLGTYVTQKLADEIRYVYSFETNTIFLDFNLMKDKKKILIRSIPLFKAFH